MTPHPINVTDLQKALGDANARGEKVTGIDLSAMNRVLEHIPEDMTVVVEAGITLAALQAELGKRGQWLPIDPSRPERLTIGALLANNESGPRRFGYGTIRDYLIGIKVALADGVSPASRDNAARGRVIKAGGKVVKNVAGYDLCKLFVGSRGSLGVIVEATFKLRPLPEAERFVQMRCDSLDEVAAMIGKVLDSPLTPVVLDLHNARDRRQGFGGETSASSVEPLSRTETGDRASAVSSAEPSQESEDGATLVLGFAGMQEEVDWQLAEARKLGIGEPSSLDHDVKFWAPTSDVGAGEAHKLSVLPSKVTEVLATLGNVPFVARAGNGVIWYRGDVEAAVLSRISSANLPQGTPTASGQAAVSTLQQRVKDAYDPNHVLPAIPV